MSKKAAVLEPVMSAEELIVIEAARALDDRESKLEFAKQVEKAREAEVSDENFSTQLLAARVHLAYGPEAQVDAYAKEFAMSASKVSQYGTTIAQLRAAGAPLTENTFADWFKLTATGGSAKTRNKLIADLTSEENADLSQEAKANVIRATRLQFIAGKSSGKGEGDGGASAPRRITLDGMHSFLERLAAQAWDDVERAEVQQALFDAASAVDDGVPYLRPEVEPVDAEQVEVSA